MCSSSRQIHTQKQQHERGDKPEQYAGETLHAQRIAADDDHAARQQPDKRARSARQYAYRSPE
jgi:hypothetical protein